MPVEYNNHILRYVRFENYLQPRQPAQLQRFKGPHEIPRILRIRKNSINNRKVEDLPINCFESYCQIASIHGFANLLHASHWQRCFWWLIITMATIVTLYFFILDVSDSKSQGSVTILKSITSPIGTVEFPSVTVCHLNRISKCRAETIAAELLGKNESMSAQHLAKMFRVALWYDTPITDSPEHVYIELDRILSVHNMTIEDLLIKITPKCRNFFTHCMWRGRRILCRKAFKQILTMEGLCCQAQVSTLAMRPEEQSEQATSLHRLGLRFMLTTNQSDSDALVYPNADFVVRVHNSKDVSSLYERGYLVRTGLSHEIKVQLISRAPAPNLRSFDIQKRACVLGNEGVKHWYKNEYTRRKCQIDCWISVWYARCNCVLPFFPRPFANISVCSLSHRDRTCFFNPIIEPVYEHKGIDCGCLPSCDFKSISSKMYTMVVNTSYSYNKDYFYDNYSPESNAVVNVYYEKLVMRDFCLEVYKSHTALLASMGGLAGLQLGFSIISFNEILFFVFIFPLGKWLSHAIKLLKTKTAVRFRVSPQSS